MSNNYENDYVKNIEQQNEELHKKLINAEKRTVNGDMAYKILKRIMKNTHFHIDTSKRPVITLDSAEITITNIDLDSVSMDVFIKLLEEVRKEQQEIEKNGMLRNAAESFSKLGR